MSDSETDSTPKVGDWTRTPPTQDGYYWWRECPTHEGHCVCVQDGLVVSKNINSRSPGFARVDALGGEWLGPLRRGSVVQSAPIEVWQAIDAEVLRAKLMACFEELRLTGGRRADAPYAWTASELADALCPLLATALARRVQ